MFERKPTFNREMQMKHFENHVATLTEYENIKILDFKNPKSVNYRIRFIFEEDWCRLHISGDLGSLSATNFNNMTFEGFHDFVHNISYFKEKIDCCERDIYEYDDEKARKDIAELLEDVELSPMYDSQEDFIDTVMEDFDFRHGLGSKAYDILTDEVPDAFESIDRIGRVDTEILELYMLAFELATKQLKEKVND